MRKAHENLLTGLLVLVLIATILPFDPIFAQAGDTVPIIEAGPSSRITREQYNAFGGIRHTSNNATRSLGDGITFVADNNNLISWYIHVTANLTGTIDIAYQIGSNHFARTIQIQGQGRYIIGDSRGRDGLNEIRLGTFVSADVPTPTPSPIPTPTPEPTPSPNGSGENGPFALRITTNGQGEAFSDGTYFAAGEVLSIIAAPYRGYYVRSFTANAGALTTENRFHFSFTMPAQDAVIHFTFAQAGRMPHFLGLDNQPIQQRLEIRHFNYDDIMHSEIYQFFSFVRGELIVAVEPHITYEQMSAFVESLGGQIVGFLELAGFYQLYFPHAHGESELLEVLDLVLSSGLVAYAERNLVSVVDNEPVVEDEIAEMPTPQPRIEPVPAQIPNISSPVYPRVMTDRFGRDFFVPNDTQWRGQWDNFVNGTATGRNWNVEAINAPHAWMHWAEQDTQSGTWQINRERHSIIRVGVIDTFFPAHEGLTFEGVFENTIPDDVTMTAYNHGIHVAGTIGADFNNDMGIAGVTPNAELYVYGLHGVHHGAYAQFLHISSFGVMHGVGTLFANDVNVINISMGTSNRLRFQSLLADGANLHTFDINAEQNNALRAERDFLTTFLMRYLDLGHDFLIVQSAGNSSNRVYRDDEDVVVADLTGRWVDARYNGLFVNITDWEIRQRIIVVGNMDNMFRSNVSSQVGNRVDIFAPGTSILSAHFNGALVGGVVLRDYLQEPIAPTGPPYRELTGTSMAAPHVAGVIAMMWGVNPYLTGVELAHMLIDNFLREISVDNNGNVQVGAERLITVRMDEDGFNVLNPLDPDAITQQFLILDAAAAVNAALDATGVGRNITERKRIVSGVVVLPDANGGNVTIEARDFLPGGSPVFPPRRVSHNVTDDRRLVPFAFLLSTGRFYDLRVDVTGGFSQRSYFAMTGIFEGRYDLTFLVIEPVRRIIGVTVTHPAPFPDGLSQDEFIEVVTPPFDFLFPAARKIDDRVLTPIAPLIEHGFEYDLFFVDTYDEIRFYTHDNRRVVMRIGYDYFRVENLRSADTLGDDAQLIDYTIFNYHDDVALQVINGSVFIPVRSIAEVLGYTVYWDTYTYTAAIMRPSGVPVQAMLMPMPSLVIESGVSGRYRWR